MALSHRSSRDAMAALLTVLLVVVGDQLLKFWVKTNFWLGEEVVITDWFRLLFVENNGMAFGMQIGSKYLLTAFRILAVVALAFYLAALTFRRKWGVVKRGYVICVALIAAGALGNIIDCLFYGLVFNNPAPPQVATFLPASGGYAPFMMGRVVDMFYFPLFSFIWPSWIPFVGGQEFLFFQPVFNVADAAISVGVIALLLFYTGYMSKLHGWNNLPDPSPEEPSNPDQQSQQ